MRGTILLVEAINDSPDPPLEMIAETARVSGRLTAADAPGAAAGHFARAVLIFEQIGHRTARSNVERDAFETLPTGALADRLKGHGAGAGLIHIGSSETQVPSKTLDHRARRY